MKVLRAIIAFFVRSWRWFWYMPCPSCHKDFHPHSVLFNICDDCIGKKMDEHIDRKRQAEVDLIADGILEAERRKAMKP